MDENIGGCGENRNICCGCGQRQSERRGGKGQIWSVIDTYNGRRARHWTENGCITGSVDVETCVITKNRFRMLDPLLVYFPSIELIEARFTSNKNVGKG